jgi:hypothetical protein
VVLVGTSSPLRRLPYGGREPADVEADGSERDMLVQPRQVQFLTPRRAPSPDLSRGGDSGPTTDVTDGAWERQR